MSRRSLSFAAWALAGALLAGGCSDEETPFEPLGDTPAPSPVEATAAATSPANGRIVYGAEVDGDLEIVSVNPDGTGFRQLTRSPGEDSDPAVSPDGRRIAFISHREGSAGLWLMNADGSRQRRLTTFGAASDMAEPTWSPDGRQIAFAARVPGDPLADYDIYVLNLKGRDVLRVLGGPGEGFDDRQPDWSPDGLTLAITRGGFNIVTVNADGSNAQPFTHCTIHACGNPDWSPDGTRIAYEVDVSSGLGVVEVKAAGQPPRVVALGLATGRGGPAWAPDGSKLVYPQSDDGLHVRLFTANPDGTSPAAIGAATTSDRAPSWGRLIR